MNIDYEAFKTCNSFLRDICKSFPEAKGSIYRNYEEILVNYESKTIKDCQLLQDFLHVIDENRDLISQRNHLFFIDNTPLLKDLSLQKVWESNLTDKTRNILWKYLETFSMIIISYKSTNELQKALQSFSEDEPINITDKKTIQDLKELKQLSENVSDTKEEEKPSAEPSIPTDLFGGMGELMNSNIGSIAKEVADSMNIEEMIGDINENSNPMEMMQKLMQGDGIGNIFSNINNVIEQKVNKGDFSQDALKQEAENIYGSMGQNPLFSSMMKSMDPSSTQESQTQASSNESSKSDDTHEKLKQKIKQKQDMRNKK